MMCIWFRHCGQTEWEVSRWNILVVSSVYETLVSLAPFHLWVISYTTNSLEIILTIIYYASRIYIYIVSHEANLNLSEYHLRSNLVLKFSVRSEFCHNFSVNTGTADVFIYTLKQEYTFAIYSLPLNVPFIDQIFKPGSMMRI